MKSIDLFGFEPKMLSNRKSVHKTHLGGVLTVVLVLVTAALALSSIEEIILRNKPNIFRASVIDTNPSKLLLNKDNFYVSAALENNKAQYYIDESYYTLDFQQITNTKQEDSNYERTTVSKEKIICDQEHTAIGLETFSDTPKSSLYCLNPAEEFHIEGIFNNETFSLLKILVRECDPLTSKVPCKSEKERADRFSGGFFGIQLSDNTFMPTEQMPFGRFSTSLFTTIDSQTSKTINIRMSRNIVKTDAGLIFTDYKEESDYSILEYDQQSTWNRTGNLVTVNLYFSNKKTEFNRSYLKLTTLMANIGATAKLLLVVLRQAVKPIAKNNFYLQLVKTASRTVQNREAILFEQERVAPKLTSSFLLAKTLCPCRNSAKNKYFTRMKILLEEHQDIAFFRRLKGEVEVLKEVVLNFHQKSLLDNIDFNQALEGYFKPNNLSVFDKVDLAEIKKSYKAIKADNTVKGNKLLNLLSEEYKKRLLK